MSAFQIIFLIAGPYAKYSPQRKAQCVIWYIETQSPKEVQKKYHAEYGKNEKAPDQKNIKRWHDEFQQRGSVHRKDRAATRFVRFVS